MHRGVEVKSIREGVYLLWCMGYLDDARNYAFSGKGAIDKINTRIATLISQEEKEKKDKNDGEKNPYKNNNPTSVQQFVLNTLNDYTRAAVNESCLEWTKDDEYAYLFLWLSLYKNYTCEDIISKITSDTRIKKRNKTGNDTEKLNRCDLPVTTPDNTSQCYLASIYLLDLIPASPEEKLGEIARIRSQYLRIKENIDTTFSWLSDADAEMLAFTWKQIEAHRTLLSEFENDGFHPAIQKYAIPVLFELWDAEWAQKELFLSRLRKRYANTKHRKKVADKAPINIRISPVAKNTLVKLEKRFNRNRADVIEYLIEKTWAELNQKN